ncbi:MAG: YibE/F family protein [Candidatus Pacebacteria bacterium]|nr:YibE/F family protein [Candidatus Paceibacterota bacterium]
MLAGLVLIAPTHFVYGQELVPEQVEIVKARVIQAGEVKKEILAGTNTEVISQDLHVEILQGTQTGTTIDVQNDILPFREGDVFYLRHAYSAIDQIDRYAVSAPNRLPALALLGALFLAVLFFFGGWQGLRGLLALGGSLFVIVYLLLPGVLAGYPPVLVAMGISSLIVVLGSYITHGFKPVTTAAVMGMLLTIAITGLLAYFAIDLTKLTGFSGDEVVYLNFNTNGAIDLVGLLLGGIMIGLLGVLYDAAIGQAVAVEELRSAGNHLSPREIYKRGIRIGREHIGALVNTLAIAYVGVALPLLLLLRVSSDQPLLITINQEMFATEIVRTLVGSIGLILAVPITTAIAVWMLANRKGPTDGSAGHSHSHSH